LRDRRLKALIDRGLVPKDVKHAPMVGKMHKEWTDMNILEQRNSARRMETYAAMVGVIDQNLGRVVESLEKTGELENTLSFSCRTMAPKDV
jgi:arylsulfatase